MIAGEGLAGVFIAFVVAAMGKWPDAAFSRSLKAIHFAAKDFAWLSGVPGIVFGIVIVLAVCALLYRAGRLGSAETG